MKAQRPREKLARRRRKRTQWKIRQGHPQITLVSTHTARCHPQPAEPSCRKRRRAGLEAANKSNGDNATVHDRLWKTRLEITRRDTTRLLRRRLQGLKRPGNGLSWKSRGRIQVGKSERQRRQRRKTVTEKSERENARSTRKPPRSTHAPTEERLRSAPQTARTSSAPLFLKPSSIGWRPPLSGRRVKTNQYSSTGVHDGERTKNLSTDSGERHREREKPECLTCVLRARATDGGREDAQSLYGRHTHTHTRD